VNGLILFGSETVSEKQSVPFDREKFCRDMAEEWALWDDSGLDVVDHPAFCVVALVGIRLGLVPPWMPELRPYLSASSEASWGAVVDDDLPVIEDIPGATGLAGREFAISRERWEQLVESHGRACLYCGATGVRLVRDHIVARSKGGAGSLRNAAPACAACNSSKHNKRLTDWLEARGLSHADVLRRWNEAGRGFDLPL
jgi:5-methylcytosine-specific restriction endonuclease McrA